MTNKEIAKILKAHSISYKECDNDIFGEEVYSQNGEWHCNMRKMTNWSLRQLRNWLGY